MVDSTALLARRRPACDRSAVRLGLMIVVAAALSASAAAAPSRDAVVRPGVSVGKIRLAMTEAQLRRAMGRPDYVVGRRKVFGGVRVEYQFGMNGEYEVTLRGRPGALRVVSVFTYLRRERLPNGLGVGARPRALRAAYGARLRCTPWRTVVQQSRTYLTGNSTCTLAGSPGSTVFLLTLDPGFLTPDEVHKARVIQLGVQSAR